MGSPKKQKHTELTDIFTDPDELEIAKRLLAVIPLSADRPQIFLNIATFIFEAYKDETLSLPVYDSIECREKVLDYVLDRQIFPRLEKAGYITRMGDELHPIWIRTHR